MTASIKILPQFIANRIAAGEVIGRPEAVVKELIENSIDAGAHNIVLRIKDAGKSLMQVVDDGTGMNEDDAILSFQRHATSKISTAEDLEFIRTLGFRGEALTSIAAVAQVEMKTKTQSDELGTLIKIHGSEIIEHTKIQTSKGTSIAVKNLFYNTPARRNFLKTNQTEFRHIYETFIKLAIANPQLSFVFVNDDEEVFNLSSTDLSDKSGALPGRLNQIYGGELQDSLIEVSQKNDLISLHGYTSKPSFTKKTKQDQFLFLNNRFIISKSLSFAVHSAYEDLIEKGDYPNFFLFLTLDPRKFDVNVHPSKLEVKFDDERPLFSFMKKNVWRTLEKNDLVVKVKLDETPLNESGAYGKAHISQASSKGSLAHSGFGFSESSTHFKPSNIRELFEKSTPPADDKENFKTLSEEENSETHPQSHKPGFITKNLVWQFQKKYIMYQTENNLMIIDQHAAHERILYEKALDRLNSNANLSQQLLMPIHIELNHVDYEVAKGIESELKSLGFDFEISPQRKIKLRGIPSDVRIGNESKALQELIEHYKENEVKLNLEKRDNLARSYACKHAIKTGDTLRDEEILNLIDNLFASKMPYVCPHGRPTIIKLSIDELDKKFARTGF